MRVVNRIAVTITGAKPYMDWTRQIHNMLVDMGDDEIEGEEI